MGQAAKKKRTYNTRLIKATWPYTVQEIAKLLNVHKGAPLRWLKEGLRANGDGRPYLIRGDELIRFLTERQQRRKHKCKLNEFWCVKCRATHEGYLNIVDIVITSPTLMWVKALCPTTGVIMRKIQAVKRLAEFQNHLHVQTLEGRHIIERDEPRVNSDLEDKP